MNQAVRNEHLAVRQELMDVSRGNLTEARDRLENYWNNAGRLFETNSLPAPALFAAAIRAHVADAVVCLDADGKPIYPDLNFRPQPGEVFPEALALQAQARSLLATSRQAAAIAVVTNSLVQPRFLHATDAEGRLIVPSAELMACENGGPPALLEPLSAQLLDYSNNMPAPQRRFLMQRVARLFPRAPVFPTLAGEELAARYLEARPPDIWAFPAAGGRVLLLFDHNSLRDRWQAVLGTNIVLLPPGQDTRDYLLAIAAGGHQPGWQLALAAGGNRLFDDAAEARIASYVWIGILALTAVAALALLAVRLIRKQAAVARLRNDLLANVTHELKTPLSSMRLLVDTLLNAPQIHEETARQYLQLIAQENLRLSRLIDNFLAFSRMERNKCAFDFTQTSPSAIVDSAASAVRERFLAAGCQFDAQAAAGLPAISADAAAMVTALLNLLDNAFKYSGERKEIRLRADAREGTVTFAVQDNGIGLAPREIKRIFKRFYQVDQRLARTGGGCGLGLSIVQFIVLAHQGDIRVESEPGRGSTFFITIPALLTP